MVQQSVPPRQSTSVPPSVAWWVFLVVIVCALLSGAGALIALINPAMLVAPRAEINEPGRIFVGYFVARNLALACALLALLALRVRRPLGQLLALIGFIQLVDTIMDCVEGRWSVAPGVLVLGIIFLFAATRLISHPIWRRAAWAD
jgi:hypothetical protein